MCGGYFGKVFKLNTMNKRNFLFGLVLSMIVFSCSQKPKSNDDLRALIKENEFALKGDSLQQFNSILDKLDDENEPFANLVYQTFYKIQDSMDGVMPQSVYDTLSDTDREAYALKKSDQTILAIEKYQKKLAITEKEEGILRYAFVLDPNVKNFCRQYIITASQGKITF